MINRRFKRTVLNIIGGPFKYNGKWCVTVNCACDENKKSQAILRFTERSDAEMVSVGYSWFTSI